MTCEEWSERIPWILNGSAEPESRRAFDAHVSGCEACSQAVRDAQFAALSYAQHPSPQLVIAYANKERIDPTISADFQQHLESCDSCNQEVVQVRLSAKQFRKKANPFKISWIATAASLLIGLALGMIVNRPAAVHKQIQTLDLISQDTRNSQIHQVQVSENAEYLLINLFPNQEAITWDAFVYDENGVLIRSYKQLSPLDDGAVSFMLTTNEFMSGEWTIQLKNGDITERFSCRWLNQSP